MTVFKCIHGHAPLYLADDCVLASSVAGWRHLRSANTMTLVLRWTKTAIGTREFAVSAAVVWNSFPMELRMMSCSVQTFAQRLNNNLSISFYERI